MKPQLRELLAVVDGYVRATHLAPIEALEAVAEDDFARDNAYSAALLDEARRALLAAAPPDAPLVTNFAGMGRAALNEYYERIIGYRPDEDNGAKLPLRELREMCEGVSYELTQEATNAAGHRREVLRTRRPR